MTCHMKKILELVTTVTLAALSPACISQKDVFLPHDIQVEYPADRAPGVQKAFLFIDAVGTDVTAGSVRAAVAAYAPDVLFLCSDGQIASQNAAQWLYDNMAECGYSNGCCAVDGYGCGSTVVSKLADAVYDVMEIYMNEGVATKFVSASVKGCHFVCGNVTNKNSIYKKDRKTLISQTVVADGAQPWLVVCRARWDKSTPWDISQYNWPGYGFSECVFSKFGMESYPQRSDFAFAYEGVLDGITSLGAEPLRFTFKYGEE